MEGRHSSAQSGTKFPAMSPYESHADTRESARANAGRRGRAAVCDGVTSKEGGVGTGLQGVGETSVFPKHFPTAVTPGGL